MWLGIYCSCPDPHNNNNNNNNNNNIACWLYSISADAYFITKSIKKWKKCLHYTNIYSGNIIILDEKVYMCLSYFCSKYRLWVPIRNTSCPLYYVWEQNLENNVYHCKPQFFLYKRSAPGLYYPYDGVYGTKARTSVYICAVSWIHFLIASRSLYFLLFIVNFKFQSTGLVERLLTTRVISECTRTKMVSRLFIDNKFMSDL